jgi:hypothetical protein
LLTQKRARIIAPMSLNTLFTGRRAVAIVIVVGGTIAGAIVLATAPVPCPDQAMIYCEPPAKVVYGTPRPMGEDCTIQSQYCCGDRDCVGGEEEKLCPEDCGVGGGGGAVCGDGKCEKNKGEKKKTCPADCKKKKKKG